MSDDMPESQLENMHTGIFETSEHHEEYDSSDAHYDEPTVSVDVVDNESFATRGQAAVLAALPQNDAAFAQRVLGVEAYHEFEPQHGVQDDVRNSIEEVLEPGVQPFNQADEPDEDEPDEQAQHTSQEPIGQESFTRETTNQPHSAMAPTSTAVSYSDNEDVELDNSSLFIPERSPSTRYPVQVSQPERLSNTPPQSRHDQAAINSNDSSSLFVPERSLPPHSPPLAAQIRPIATPSRPTTSLPRQDGQKFSLYSKVRLAQKRARDRHAASTRAAAASRIPGDFDAEACLEAVTKPQSEAHRQPGVDGEERAHKLALARFQKNKKYYDALERTLGGKLGIKHDIEWSKIKREEQARLGKRQREMVAIEMGGDEEDLFPPVRNLEDEEEVASAETLQRVNTSRKRSHHGEENQTFQDAEVQAMRVALEAQKDGPKKKKQKNDNDGDSQPTSKKRGPRSKTTRARRAPAAANPGKPAARGSRKTAKDKRAVEQATRQVASLFNADIFEQQAGSSAAEQPSLRRGNKVNSLKELLTSLPVAEHKQAKSDRNALLQASKDFDGIGACKIAPANDGNWLVRGMKTSLKGYQVLGAAFMRRRENDASEPRGGLLADQMGLGKTLMTLANMVNSRDSMIRTKSQGHKTTLLVASPALLTQWASEIEQHTKLGMTVLRYGAGTRLDSNNIIQTMSSYDIILTTYSEVMKSYPKNAPPIECQTAEEKIAWWKKTYSEFRGVLHQMYFKRVVLDEAQAIKNHQSRTSIACRALMASHKWALSGTPILNSLEELYPYFKFLNVPHTGSFQIFKRNYCGSNSGENNERLLVRLSQFMIRRTHADRMFNAPILKLPQASQSTYWCEFNRVERCVYIIVEQRFATRIRKWSKKGTLDRAYSNILVMLLRLRQLTGHILMLQFVMRDLLEREDIERIKEVVKEQAASSNSKRDLTIISIRKQLEAYEDREKKKAAARAAKRAAAEVAARNGAEYIEPESDDESEDDAPLPVPHEGGARIEDTGTHCRNESGKSFGESYEFKPYINSLTVGDAWEQKKERAKCGECNKRPLKPWKTACGHLLCEVPCYENVMVEAAEQGNVHGTCKACGQTFSSCNPCDEEQDDVLTERSTRSKAAAKEKKRKERLDREDIADDWLSLDGEEILPSAKTIAVKAQILNWITENPDVKVIVYTQFLAMIRILAKMCQQEGWKAEQYHGKLSLPARDESIREFATNPSSKILLASLRCGGLGLNLTMASKVIMMDPWWNQASEQQAFCRVFRIGQQVETIMTRMCVQDTVDERLIAMQKRKQQEIDGVMEDRGKRTKNIGLHDLLRLFGNVVNEGDTGFLMVDNPAAGGGFHPGQDHEGYADEV